ncbi:MAG: RHS repeat-associated core domain-containing protein [Terracidiphilus sp.]
MQLPARQRNRRPVPVLSLPLRPHRTPLHATAGPSPYLASLYAPTEHHFTGKERDTESGNDYFGARYYASSMGRFMSPDWSAKVAPVPYAKLDNPQTLNLYAYVGNDPMTRFDADGHAIQLLGEKAAQGEELHEVQNEMDNNEARERLYSNSGTNGRTFVGVKGDLASFEALGPSEKRLGEVIKDQQIVEFGFTKKDLSKFGGSATFDKGEDGGNQNIRILINKQQTLDIGASNLCCTPWGQMKFLGQMKSPAWDIRNLTIDITFWHELGHAWAGLHGKPVTQKDSGPDAVEWENEKRKQTYGDFGPNNAPRAKD